MHTNTGWFAPGFKASAQGSDGLAHIPGYSQYTDRSACLTGWLADIELATAVEGIVDFIGNPFAYRGFLLVVDAAFACFAQLVGNVECCHNGNAFQADNFSGIAYFAHLLVEVAGGF